MRKPRHKRIPLIAGTVILGLLALLGYTFTPKAIDVSAYEAGALTFERGKDSNPSTLPDVTLSLIKCGKMMSKQVFVFRGGSVQRSYESGMAAVLVRHPNGSLLFDTGFGSNVDQHVKTIPLLMRAFTTYDKEIPAAVQLKEQGISAEDIRAIIISHSHWDHVSGLDGFPGVKVWLSNDEADYIKQLGSGELIKQMSDQVNLSPISFTVKQYENFQRSLDVFADGSIVLVPLPGHTPGSLGMFVNLRSGKRFFFIGDLTWAIEGVQIPAERPWVARTLVDYDDDGVRRSIVRVYELMNHYPDMVIVPAHDRRVHDRIASFPDQER